MTREEFGKITMLLIVYFPEMKQTFSDKFSLNAWYKSLGDLDYSAMESGIYAYVQTEKFPPKICELREKANMFKPPAEKELSELEAWALVSKAIKNGNYGAEKEFEALPRTVQLAVGSPANIRAWATTDVKSLETVVASNFQRTYRDIAKRESKYETMSPAISNLIESRQEPYSVPQIETTEIDHRQCVQAPADLMEMLRGKLNEGE